MTEDKDIQCIRVRGKYIRTKDGMFIFDVDTIHKQFSERLGLDKSDIVSAGFFEVIASTVSKEIRIRVGDGSCTVDVPCRDDDIDVFKSKFVDWV